MGMPRAQVNKAHKSRFASKSSRNSHRTSNVDKGRITKSQKNIVKRSRATRIQHNKKVRDERRAALLKEKRASIGSSFPPRVIVLLGLSGSVDLSSFARDLLTLSAADRTVFADTVASPTFRLRTTVLQARHGDLLSCMEMAKVADLLAFVVSGNSLCNGCEEAPIDSFGSQCLSVLRAVGLPSTVVLIRDIPDDIKKRQDLKKLCSFLTASELPEDCKIYLADTKEELSKFMWLFKEQHLSAPHWRAQRPYLLSHEIDVKLDVDDPGKDSLILSGYVRAHNFSVNQLVHVSGAGDFQLSKIEVLKDPFPISERKNHDSMDSDDSHDGQEPQVVCTLLPDPMKAEPLLVENVPDPLAGEQTWPTETEMVEADARSKERKLKKKAIPHGTSDYQAAWIIENSDDDDVDSENSEDEGDGMVLDQEKNSRLEQEGYDHSDLDEDHINLKDEVETEPDTMMADDENWTAEQIKAEIEKVKEEHAEDEEFPDEVDTPIDVPARKRFAKYRGLKSFRTSSWDCKESLPKEYARIFAFDNFKRTHKYALANSLETDQGNLDEYVPVGSYVRLYIKQVPQDITSQLRDQLDRRPVVVSGLLQHESKMSVLHFSIKKHDSYDAPIKSKESLIFDVGFRQFVARPLFSADNMNSDKHKMERFLHPGCFSIASVYAPISFPPLPLIVLKSREGMEPAVAAFGSLRSVDPDRIILKKIILTGYPQRVSKSKAAVRFMFHNPDDVRWFKPVELWTKYGRRGRIKEPVGTHGHMKCLFNGVVQQHDTVCMNLYKRVYPKWPEKQLPTWGSGHQR